MGQATSFMREVQFVSPVKEVPELTLVNLGGSWCTVQREMLRGKLFKKKQNKTVIPYQFFFKVQIAVKFLLACKLLDFIRVFSCVYAIVFCSCS